jgi:hypothetical protein
MEVISIADRSKAKRKQDLLEIIDELRSRVEAGDIEEFVGASMDTEGEILIHACVMDVAGGVGMFEIGKHILITQNA